MTDSSILGKMLWYELLTTDVEAAKRFYTSVVGWTVTPFPASAHAYDMWTRPGGGSIGGVMTIPEGMHFPPHWGMYVGVPRLEDGVAHVERLGGSALSGVIDIPTVGRMRTMKDPHGATFSLMEVASPARQPDAEPELGDVAWRELYTTDADAAMTFYSELFGWRSTGSMDMGPMGTYHLFGREIRLGGMMNKPPAMAQAPSHWGFYFRVPDVHAAIERVKAGGGQVLNDPMEVPGGAWIVNCMDPQGAGFSLHHLA